MKRFNFAAMAERMKGITTTEYVMLDAYDEAMKDHEVKMTTLKVQQQRAAINMAFEVLSGRYSITEITDAVKRRERMKL